MKISLLGQFGSGNSGNDGSLEAMLICLRRLQPDAELLCICSNPAEIKERYDVPSIGVGGPPWVNRWSRTLDRLFGKLPRRLWLLPAALTQFGGIDLMIIPGTGILDDFGEKAFGWPFVIFCWCLVARLRKTDIAFVSIGAGPIKGRLSRWFLRSAAKMASYRSYRDDYSLEFMRTLGLDVSTDRRYPDIAFHLPTPAPQPQAPNDGRLNIAVGIMHYRGWHGRTATSGTIYENYIGKISAFVGRLVENGYNVTLLTGDATDQRACADVIGNLSEVVTEERLQQVGIGPGGSLHDIMEQVSVADLAVVSRYHNLVCALKLGKPCISLGYARKNDDLMRDFGQQQFCGHIETFEVDWLIELVDRVVAEGDAVRNRIQEVNGRLQAQLQRQQQLLGRYLALKASSPTHRFPLTPLEPSAMPQHENGNLLDDRERRSTSQGGDQ